MMTPSLPVATDSYGLTRYAYRRTTGWLARYYGADRVHSKLFADSRYGYDPAAARRAAAQWLLARSRTVAPVPTYRRGAPRNNTGHMGISLTTKVERNGARFAVYQVTWVARGRRRTKTFRVHRYPSREAAFQAAHAFRRAMEAQMDGERVRQVRRRLARQVAARDAEA